MRRSVGGRASRRDMALLRTKAAFALLVSCVATEAPSACPVTSSHAVVYSKASGVGGASVLWVEDFLWWLKQAADADADAAPFSYIGLVEGEIQACDFASFPNLRLYINPGGNAYNQLAALNVSGTANIKAFVTRNASRGASAYAGFCAGAYMASENYLWETMFEGGGYFDFRKNPPLGLFPHTVEGSLVDINDDQYSDQFGHKYRAVNVSNGHTMVYFGGSSFGFNGAEDISNPESPQYDKVLEVLLYYQDFYGYKTVNLPAAWRYKNMLLTSIHAEADNCTQDRENAETADCPAQDDAWLTEAEILRNRAWLVKQINAVAGTKLVMPPNTPQPNMSVAKPHSSLPVPACRAAAEGKAGAPLFCDGFDSSSGAVYAGLTPQWQRNQSNYNSPQPWNTTFVDAWPGCARPCSTGSKPNGRSITYGKAHSGDGYAVCVPHVSGYNSPHKSAITSRAITVPAAGATLSYWVRGCTNCTDSSDFKLAELAAATAAVAEAAFAQEDGVHSQGRAAGSTALQSARSDPACQAALAKACPGLAHKGPTCHACTIARQKTLGPPSGPCSFVGNPPPDIQEYCRGGGPGPAQPNVPHGGDFSVHYCRGATTGEACFADADPEQPDVWTMLRNGTLKGGASSPWAQESWKIPPGQGAVRVRFSCSGATQDGSNYCAIDTLTVV